MEKGNGITKLISQSTVATPLVTSVTDNKTNDQESLYGNYNQR